MKGYFYRHVEEYIRCDHCKDWQATYKVNGTPCCKTHLYVYIDKVLEDDNELTIDVTNFDQEVVTDVVTGDGTRISRHKNERLAIAAADKLNRKK